MKDGATLDGLFEDMFGDRIDEELEAIRKKYATKGNILEAPALIAEKARDMLRHYVTNLLPNGYKAQVVSYSRTAVVRYRAAFLVARDELMAEASAPSDHDKAMGDEELCSRSAALQARVQAWRYRDALERIEFAAIMSGATMTIPHGSNGPKGRRRKRGSNASRSPCSTRTQRNRIP